MARPLKKGLDYFPLDVDWFDDEKLIDVQNNFGPLGEVIYIRLLCLIYKNGYYYEFASMDRLCAMMIRSIGSRWVRGKHTVEQVILQLAESNLFDMELVRSGVLTSVGIQRRYLKAVERRQCNIDKYWLLEKNEIPPVGESMPKNNDNATETEVSVYNNSVNVGNKCIKESKGKKSKLNDIESVTPAPHKQVNRTPRGKNGNVMLSDQELYELTKTYKIPSEYIDHFSEALKVKKYSYPYHYTAIIEWWNKDKEQPRWNTTATGGSFNTDEFFQAAVMKNFNE